MLVCRLVQKKDNYEEEGNFYFERLKCVFKAIFSASRSQNSKFFLAHQPLGMFGRSLTNQTVDGNNETPKNLLVLSLNLWLSFCLEFAENSCCLHERSHSDIRNTPMVSIACNHLLPAKLCSPTFSTFASFSSF